MNRRFLVTGALPYSNGRLHVGHIAGAYLPADIYVRYLRSRGDDVRFICGSDDNGVAALKSAREEGKPVEELTAHYNASQRRAFEGLGICFDIYGGTHQPDFVALHEKLSQEFFLKIHEKGFFTKKKTRQLFDVQAGMFLPDRFVTGICHYSDCGKPGAYGDQCESCGRSIDPLLLKEPTSVLTGTRPEPRETVHWYLRLDQLAPRLEQWLRGKGETWRASVLNFALGQIAGGLPERSMTRDLSWGVPVPLDDPDAKGKTLYVWFDAPIGYVSFTAALCAQRGEGPQAYEKWWKRSDCRIVHFIGEDNTIFHALTWPAMLLATHDSDSIQGEDGEYQLPWNVVANAFLNIQFPGREEEKISKSRGTAIWIEDYLKTFDPDPLRYYLTAIAPENQRTAWDFDAFVERNNSELIATLGNFVNRWQKIVTEDFGRIVPAATKPVDADRGVLAEVDGLVASVGDDLEGFRFKSALGRVMDGFRACNRYIDVQAPWKSRKTDRDLCATTVNTCIQCTRTLGVLLAPFLPFAGEKIRASLGCGADEWTWPRACARLADGRALGPAPEILFRRLDIKEFGV
jgi:methionyl-tRNA synthetase